MLAGRFAAMEVVMKMIGVLLLAIGAGAIWPRVTSATELRLVSAGPMRPVISQIAAEFERSTGIKIAAKYVSGPAVKTEIESGGSFDVAISSAPVIDELIRSPRDRFT